MGQLLVIVTRGVDLSVGAMVALASVVGALAFGTVDAGLAIIVVMLATGLTVGPRSTASSTSGAGCPTRSSSRSRR